MKEDIYVAGQVERALKRDPRTHELGVRVLVDGDVLEVSREYRADPVQYPF